MAQKTFEETSKTDSNIITRGFVTDDTKPSSKTLVYEINRNTRSIEYFPTTGKYYFFDKITLNGFIQLPEIFPKTGYAKNRILEYINRAFKDKNVKSIIINRTGKSEIIKRGKNIHVHIAYRRILQLTNEIGSMNFYYKRRRSSFITKTLNQEFPTLIKIKTSSSSREEIKQALQMLTSQGTETFEKDDIIKITDILSSLMKSTHKSEITKSDLFKKTKLKLDTVTLDQVIGNFEFMLKSETSEAKWGKFLEDNLFLIDSKYIHSLPQLNLVLGGSRKVDFGLVDIQGYLDLFEIKKPETRLLTSKKDSRGNYVWDKQALEAIVQAEKYLLHAESKRSILKDDILRERQVTLDVIRPRAFVLMGNSSELDNKDKKEDFRMLKNQFKNIEIVLYDELLERIKNQKRSLE